MKKMAKYSPENQEQLEYLILLALGSSKRILSMIHIEKEIFFLWNSSNIIKELFDFIAHYKGPFSRSVSESVKSPMFLDEYWEYLPPKKGDDISGGFIRLNDSGRSEYEKLNKKIHDSNNKKLIHILSAMELIHDLYDNLSPEELLFVVYTNPKYKEFVKKSEVFNEIVTKRRKEQLKKKIDSSLFEYKGMS